MRLTLPLLVLGLGTAACATDPATTSSAAGVTVDPSADLLEPTYLNGGRCKIDFQGALTSSTEYYAIWAIGTNGIYAEGDPSSIYTASRPNIYAIFGTSPSPDEVHHVANFDAYDHYHVLDAEPGSTDTGNKNWDLWVYVPGPNFNSSTYTSARTVDELNDQTAAGVLSAAMTPTTAFGLPGLVLHAPILCN